jgi:hypothetical protein
MAAMSLAEMIAGLKDELIRGIVTDFARQSTLFQKMLPFRNVGSFAIKDWRVETITDAVFRDIGEPFTDTKDQFSEALEGIYLLGGKIDLDSALELPSDAHREINPLTENVRLQSERYRFAYLNRLLNGDRATSPKGFDGLSVRVEDVGGDQVIDVTTGGAHLDLSVSSANRQTFLDYVQQAMFETGADGKPDLIIAGKQGSWQLTRVARREGLLDTTKDAFDRDIESFMGVPIVYAGTQGDQSTQIITNTETTTGDSTADATSLYFVKLGYPYVQGLQLGGPVRTFDAIIDDGVTRRIVFQWPVGLLVSHKKAIVRLKGFKAI